MKNCKVWFGVLALVFGIYIMGITDAKPVSSIRDCIDKEIERLKEKPVLGMYKSVYGENIVLDILERFNGKGSLPLGLFLNKNGVLGAVKGNYIWPLIVPPKFYHWKNEIVEIKMKHPDGKIYTHTVRIFYNISSSCTDNPREKNIFGSIAELYDTDGSLMSILVGVGESYYQIIPYRMVMREDDGIDGLD